MARKEFTDKTKDLAFERSGGICQHNLCTETITRHTAEYDHVIACNLPGVEVADNSLANCMALCVECHKIKTRADAAERAKRKRQVNRRAGKPKRKRGPAIQSRGFDKTRTKKFNGNIEARR